MNLDYLSPYYWFMKSLNKKNNVQSLSIPVISIGNMNTGGSGKTPFIKFLVDEIKKNHPEKKIVIISKSYKASLKKPQEVLNENINRTDIFGDEPCLLKSLVDADVWSGPIKFITLNKAISEKKYDLAIVDDGFSHRQISPDLNIVLFDISRTKNHYQIIPFGFMREPWSSLGRSDLVVLTKLENQDLLKIGYFKNKIKKFQKNILTSEFITSLNLENKNVYLFSGIGNPEALKNNLINKYFNIVQSKFYPDHYEYPIDEQNKILKNYLEINSNIKVSLLTTSKDAIKITLPGLKKEICIIDVFIKMSDLDLKVINEKINQLF